MNRLSRPTALKIAATLSVLLYFPYGTLGQIGQGFNRTVTNLRGEQLKITGNDGALFINGKPIGGTSVTFVANGTRVMSVSKLLLDTK